MLWLLLTISIHHIKKNLMRIEKLEKNNLHLNVNLILQIKVMRKFLQWKLEKELIIISLDPTKITKLIYLIVIHW